MTKFVWICIFSIMSIIPIITTVRIFSLQQIYQDTSNVDEVVEYKERGPIFDRNGNILAMQIDSWNVGLRLIDTANPNQIIEILSKTLSIPKDVLQAKLKYPEKYVRIKKFISKQEYDTLMKYRAEGQLYGVQINTVPWRKYPGNESMSHVIGYYGEAGIGLDGIESSFDEYLSPPNQNIGNSIYLTIDSVLQKNIEYIVKKSLELSDASYITTILMDAENGDILSYVEAPNFDLNQYYNANFNVLTNKITTHSYEPGSVFKIFSLASALDAGVINLNTRYDNRSAYVDPVYGFVINDVDYHGIITTSEIIKYSSNVGISLATYNMDEDLLYNYLYRFGFGQKTNIQLPGESKGIFYPPSRWSARSKATIALGQEIAVTAIQMISASTAIANKGELLAPNLIKKIVSPSGEILYQSSPIRRGQIISAETAQHMLTMMHSATEGGTARRMKIDGINISAKTGTAQVFDVSQKAYSETDFIASSLSIVPTENPELIVYSVIHTPQKGEVYGGRTAAPMIKEMLEFILPYLGYVGKNIQSESHNVSLPNNNGIKAQILQNKYNDYIGLSKREIWSIFANSKIQVSMVGTGTVVRQNPSAGTEIVNNKHITLYFE